LHCQKNESKSKAQQASKQGKAEYVCVCKNSNK
jgi:hypothetical protein